MTENDHTSWEERLLAAAPREVRSMTADIPRRAPVDEPTPPAPAEPSAGAGDGGTSTTPRPTINLEHEQDGARIREAAAKLQRTR